MDKLLTRGFNEARALSAGKPIRHFHPIVLQIRFNEARALSAGKRT